MFGHNSTGFGWGKKGVAQNLGQTIALNHYNRVTAAGGVLPCGVAALASIINAICTALGLTSEAAFQAAVPLGLDPHYSGYLAGAGSGPTLGQACQKIFNWAGASGDVSQGTAGSMPLLLSFDGVNKYVWFSGVSGNYCSTPSTYQNDDWDVEFKVKSKWSINGGRIVGTRSIGDGTNIEMTSNAIYLEYKIGATTYNATALTTNTDDVEYTIRVTRNSATGAVTFVKNGVTLTTTGSQIAGALTSNSYAIQVGAILTGIGAINGSLYWIKFYTSGSVVRYFNPNSYNAATSQTSWVSATSETWTINIGTATTGYKAAIVDKTIVQYDGVDDRLSATGLFNRSVLTKYVCERYSKPAAYMTSNASNSFLIYTNGGGIPRAAAATEVVFTGTTMFTKLDILTAVFGASGVTMVNNANQATGDLSGNSGTELYLGSGSTANYMNCLINTYIEVNSANDSTQRTAMWNVIKTMNNL